MGVKLPQKISEEEITLRMMRDEDQWSQWPVLPIKRRKPGQNWPDMAYLYSGRGTTIYMGNIWSRSKDDPAQKYDSFEAIVRDGWVVD